jgi:hypothetical protein
LHFCLLSAGLGLLIWSLYKPWASGQGSLGLINRTAYAYNEPVLYFPFGILITLIVVASVFGLLSLLWPARSTYGIFIIFTGIIASVLGLYIWGRIEASDVYLLFKVAEVQPDLGILFMILGGGALFLDGLIYLK